MGGPAFTRANGYASTCEVSLDRRVALSLRKHERPVSIRASGRSRAWKDSHCYYHQRPVVGRSSRWRIDPSMSAMQLKPDVDPDGQAERPL